MNPSKETNQNFVTKEISNLDILARLEIVEKQNEDLREELVALRCATQDVVKAFSAASGAFTFLEGLARVVKPILFIASLVAAFLLFVKTGRVV